MTDEASARAQFADLVHEALRTTAPNFRFSDVLARGRADGLLSGVEVNDMNVHLRAPVWLAEALARRAPPGPPEVALPAKALLSGGVVALQPARTASGTRLPESFAATQARFAPVALYQGGPSTHNLPNFGKLGWTDQGVLAQVSDPNAKAFLPYLAECAPVDLEGHVFLGVVEGSVVYTHWLLDTLPRLLLLSDGGVDLAGIDTFLFASSGAGFQRATLDALGIPADKVRARQHIGPLVRVKERFTHVSAPRSAFACNRRIYDAVRSFFMGSQPAPRPTRRLFLTRRGAKRRRMLNEDAVIEMLTPLGFEVVAFEDHPISETARMVAEATHLIAPHGAGLANLVFGTPGLRVLELFNAHLSAEYSRICSQRGFHYHAMETLAPGGQRLDPASLRQMDFFARNAMDLQVDVAALRDYVTEAFLGR